MRQQPRAVTMSLLTSAIAVIVSITVPAEAQHCSIASVGGVFGYTSSGFVAAPSGAFVPVAAEGRIVFDGHGNVSGTQTRSLGGSALEETFSGTYTVSADCTGSFTVVVQPDTRTSTINLVWTDDTNGVSAVFTTPGFVLTATARRIQTKD